MIPRNPPLDAEAWLRKNSRVITDEGIGRQRDVRKLTGMLALKLGYDPVLLISEFDSILTGIHMELVRAEEARIRARRELHASMREDARTQVPKMVRPVGTTWRDAGFPCKLADFQGEACGGTCDWVAGVLGIFDESDGSDGKFSDLCRRKLFDRLSSTQFSAPCSKCRRGTLFRLEVV